LITVPQVVTAVGAAAKARPMVICFKAKTDATVNSNIPSTHIRLLTILFSLAFSDYFPAGGYNLHPSSFAVNGNRRVAGPLTTIDQSIPS
jgi:hypothetical protein